MRSLEAFAVLGVSQEIGLAHIKIEVNRIKRHKRRQQCRRTGRRATACNQIAHGNEMRPNAASEWRRDPAMVKVELSVPDPCLRVFHRSPGCPLIGSALVYVFHASSVALFQIFSATKLKVSQFQASRRNIELGSRFGELNLIGTRINGEKEVTLPHDVPILEKYSGERAAYLSAQLNLGDGRKLTKEAQPSVNVLQERFAHHYLRQCSWPGIG